MTGPGPDHPADPLALMKLAAAVAREAAELILAAEDKPEVEATKSSATDVVTAMDRAVEDLLVQRLRQARPEDGVLGEERGAQAGTSGVTWVLDPIDGTVNYLYGRPDYAVSVAAVTGDPMTPGAWRPLAGCVLQPATGHTWTAAAGQGAWRGSHRLRLGPPPELSQSLISTGFGYRAQRRAGQAAVVARLLPQVRDIRRVGSSALDMCGVACGTSDAYYERGVNVWDVAAATLVLTEAGGSLRGLGDAPPSPEMVVAAGQPLCDTLAELLTDLGADADPDGQ